MLFTNMLKNQIVANDLVLKSDRLLAHYILKVDTETPKERRNYVKSYFRVLQTILDYIVSHQSQMIS